MPVRISKASKTSSPGRFRPSKSTSSHDNIAKLNSMNKSLQRSYYQHPEPFKPSGAVKENFSPTSSPLKERKEQYGFKYRANPSESQELTNVSSFSPDRQRRTGSEYKDKFPEWELLNRKTELSPEKRYSSLHNFNVDFGVSNWESENKRSFKSRQGDTHVHEPQAVAGVPTKRPAKQPASYNWSGIDQQDKENFENQKQSLKAESKFVWGPNESVARDKSARVAENAAANFDLMYEDEEVVNHAPQYSRKETFRNRNDVDQQIQIQDLNVDHAFADRANASGSGAGSPNDMRPFHRRKSELHSIGDTEYKSSFIKRPIDQGEKFSKKSGKNGKQKTKVVVEVDENKDAYRNFRTTSEYKEKFQEWELPEKEAATLKTKPTDLYNFDTSSNVAQWQSENHNAFKEHDLEIIQEPLAPVAGVSTKYQGDKPPAMYAWGADRQLDERSTPTVRFQSPSKQRADSFRVEHPQAYRQTLSEYNHEYNWPPLEAYGPITKQANQMYSASPELEKSLKFDAHRGLANAQSEYQEQYFDISRYSGFRPSTSTKRTEANPPQFAWPLMDGELKQPAPSSPKRKEFSEYTAKYHWPSTNVNPVSSPGHRPSSPGDSTTPVFAVDNEKYDASKWQSEYDSKCAELRKKQQELFRPVAGVATKLVNNIPSNFAWVGDQQKPPADYQPTSAQDPSHFKTEYLENFLRWRVDGAQPSTLTKAEDQLNLFQSDSRNTGVGKASFNTEYQEKFQAVIGNEEVQFKKKDSGSIPPQFAWPLVDKPLPSPPPQRSQAPRTIKTEHQSNFAWPPQPPAVPLKKPEDHSPLFGIDEQNKDAMNWKSEYDSHASDIRSPPNNDLAVAPAGVTTTNTENVPSFFAWAEEEDRPPQPPAIKVFHDPEAYKTESHESFRKPRDIVPQEKFHDHDTLNLFDGTKEEASKFPETYATEYESNFKKVNHDNSVPNTHSVLQRNDLERPPQFAWPLIDKEDENQIKQSARNPPLIPFTETTEYDSKFTWKTDGAQARKSRDGFKPSIIAPSRKDSDLSSTTKEWQSEYDNRFNELRRRQQEIALAEEAKRNYTPVAGKKTAEEEEAPHFYVWSALDAPKTEQKPLSSSEDGPPEVSEYRDQFQSFKSDFLNITDKMLANSRRFESTKEHITGTRSNEFDGRTEYGDNFNTVNSLETTIPVNRDVLQHHQQIKYGQTLRCTNLDRSYKEPLKDTQRSRSPPRMQDIRKIKQIYTTEYNDHFDWPEKLHTSLPISSPSSLAPSNALRNTQVATSAAPAVINPVNEAVKTLKETLKMDSTLSKKILAAGRTPMTETQEKFAWPSDTPKVASDGSVQLSSSAKKAKKTSKKVYHSYLSASTPALLAPGTKIPWNFARTTAKSQAAPNSGDSIESPDSGKKAHKKYTVMSKNSPSISDTHSNPGSPTTHDEHENYSNSQRERSVDRATSTRFHPTRIHYDENDNRYTDQARDRGETITTAGTSMTQDSLNIIPSTNTVMTTTTGSSGRSSSRNNTSSHPRSALTGDDTTVSSLGGTNPQAQVTDRNQPDFNKTLTAPLNQINDEWKMNYIPGLRSTEQYRSRSAPPRRTLSSEYDRHVRAKMYVDDSASNPVLINRRYPEISDRQTTRWSTETKDAFRWKTH